jgi:hypothetical protein
MSQESAANPGGTWRRYLGPLRRIIAYLVVAFSIVGILICVAATVGTWIVAGSTKDGVTNGVERVDAGLGQAQEKLQRINAGLGTINDASLDPERTTLSSTIVEVNGALQALNSLPFVFIPTLDTDRFQALSARVQAGLATAAGAVESAEAKTADLEMQVGAARVQVEDFGKAATRWINLIAIALTVVQLWLALAQASLCRSAWRYARSGA